MKAVGFLLMAAFAFAARADEPGAKDREFFEARVRPLLVEHCYKCHSTDAKKRRGNLLLDSREGWRRGGDNGPAVIPGDPDGSLVIQAVRYDDPGTRMPPGGKLPDEAVAVLTDWVKRGAPDPRVGAAIPLPKVVDIEAGRKHWAFQPLTRAEPPPVRDESWCRNPIDRFVLARLEAKGIKPNAEATRRQWIRRLSFDLTGLPPSPEDVEAFAANDCPDAYDLLVDRLLDSPSYGERWARHWLDLARFGESHGFEHDYDRPSAYHYRDFVIGAFNRDLPFNTFAQWQVAGDELAPDDNLALKATGFLAAGVHSTQITANQVEKERYDELDDIVNTAGTAFLGLTVGCARCHDHKYDPIPTADYYRLVANFTTTVRSEIDLNLDPEGYRKSLARYDAEHAPYLAALSRFEAEELPSRLRRWEANRTTKPAPTWVVLDPSSMKSRGGAAFTKCPDGSIEVGGQNADFDTFTIVAPCDLDAITAVKLEPLASPKLAAGGPGRAPNGNFALTDFSLTIGPRYGIGKTEAATLINPKATFEQAGLPVAAAIDADKHSGWAVDPQFGRDHAAVFEVSGDARTDSGSSLTFTLDFRNNARHALGRFRLSATNAPRPVGLDGDGLPPHVLAILARPAEARSADQNTALLAWYATIDPQAQALRKAVDDHAKTAPKPDGVKALICTEGLPAVRLHTQGGDFLEKTHILRRGDPNQKGDVAEPGFLRVLTNAGESRWKSPPPAGCRTSHRRAGLARWMSDPDEGAGHLMARVIVNRVWQHDFGRGLVATPSDFGRQGEPPSHPELLDWLASELIRGGWKLKPIHKLIVSSAAYRQSSRIDAAKQAVDVENLLCWRNPRRRLEAEAIRDALLAVSGKLDPRVYGPGTLDERTTRRSVYFTVKRSKLIPMMMAFDAPDALQGLAVRSSTTVAPQSLYLMNSPIVRDWAEAFAGRVETRSGGKPDESIRLAYATALGRPPDDRELADALAFLAPGGAGTLADLCQVLMALNEFIYVE